MSENSLQQYESFYLELIEDIKSQRPIYVAIEGPECSGKTHLATTVQEKLGFVVDQDFKNEVRSILNKYEIREYVGQVANYLFNSYSDEALQLAEDLLMSGFLLYTGILSKHFNISFIYSLKETLSSFEYALAQAYRRAYESLPKDYTIIFDRFMLTQILYLAIIESIDEYIDEFEQKDKIVDHNDAKQVLQDNEFLINTILVRSLYRSESVTDFLITNIAYNKTLLVKTSFQRPMCFVISGLRYKQVHGQEKLERIYRQMLEHRYPSLSKEYQALIDAFAYYNARFVVEWYAYALDLFKFNMGSYTICSI